MVKMEYSVILQNNSLLKSCFRVTIPFETIFGG